jgi:SH3-like domain-containing protein
MTRAALPNRQWPSKAICLLATIVTVAFASQARAETSNPTFDEANRLASEGRYADAAAAYETLARKHGWSAPLLYDLGNAYAQGGNVGRSVLSYERAHVLAPRDPDIAANLAYVRATAGLPIPVRPWYEALARLFTPTTWTLFAVLTLWLAGAGLVATRRWRSRRLIYVAAAAALVGVMSVAATVVLDRDLNHAVVVERKSAPVRVSPFDTAASETTVSEGQDVSIIAHHGDFLRVRDGQGRTGWVQSTAVQPVVPRQS